MALTILLEMEVLISIADAQHGLVITLQASQYIANYNKFPRTALDDVHTLCVLYYEPFLRHCEPFPRLQLPRLCQLP